MTTYTAAPNMSINIGDTTLVYRDLGPRDSVPVVMLNHCDAVLDNFGPRIVDGLANQPRVIASNYRGAAARVGLSIWPSMKLLTMRSR